jgi:hypothetical protein
MMVSRWFLQDDVTDPIICTNWGRLLPQREKGFSLWYPLLMTPACYGISVSMTPWIFVTYELATCG